MKIHVLDSFRKYRNGSASLRWYLKHSWATILKEKANGMIYSCFSGSLELSLLKFNIFLVCSFTKPLEVYYKKVLYAICFPTKRSSLFLEKWKDYVRELIMHPRLLTAVDNEVLLKVLLRRNTKITTGIRKCITWCINNSLYAVRMDEKSQELHFSNLIVV